MRRPHLLDGEAVRDHQRLGTVVAGGGQQLERAAAVGLGAVDGGGAEAWGSGGGAWWVPQVYLASGDLSRPTGLDREIRKLVEAVVARAPAAARKAPYGRSPPLCPC